MCSKCYDMIWYLYHIWVGIIWCHMIWCTATPKKHKFVKTPNLTDIVVNCCAVPHLWGDYYRLYIYILSYHTTKTLRIKRFMAEKRTFCRKYIEIHDFFQDFMTSSSMLKRWYVPMKKTRENSGIFHRHVKNDTPPESCCASCMSLSTLACSWFRWSLSKKPEKSGTPDVFS